MAAVTSAGEALEYEAIVVAWSAGFCCLEMVEVLICSCQYQVDKVYKNILHAYLFASYDNRHLQRRLLCKGLKRGTETLSLCGTLCIMVLQIRQLLLSLCVPLYLIVPRASNVHWAR